jgi:gas vesicle protein
MTPVEFAELKELLIQMGVLIGIVATLITGVTSYVRTRSDIKRRDVEDEKKLSDLAADVSRSMKEELTRKDEQIKTLTENQDACRDVIYQFKELNLQTIEVINSLIGRRKMCQDPRCVDCVMVDGEVLVELKEIKSKMRALTKIKKEI